MRGRFPIAISQRASRLAEFLTEELVSLWEPMQRYYTEEVHSRLLRELPTDHPLLASHLNEAQRLDLGMDHYWDYMCDRTIREHKFSLDLYEEVVWVQEKQLLYMPPYFFHGSGPHPLSYGYSIRAHVYLTPENAGAAAEGQGNVYDFRGDRQFAPLARYFPARTTARMDMYVTADGHSKNLFLLSICLVWMNAIKLLRCWFLLQLFEFRFLIS